MNRPQMTRQDVDTLRDTNLRLKNKNNTPYFDKTQNKGDKPHFQKKIKPREMIRTSWYKLQRGGPPEFQFNALLHEIPKEREIFNDDNNNVLTVKNVTRNLITAKPGAMREVSISVLFSQKETR